MEVLEVELFDVLFVTEPPQAEGRGPEKLGAPKRKKGPIDEKTAAQAATSGSGRMH